MAHLPAVPPAPQHVDPPEHLIFELAPIYITDDVVQNKFVRFLKKAFTSALTESAHNAHIEPGATEETVAMRRLEAFVKTWVSDSLYRLF